MTEAAALSLEPGQASEADAPDAGNADHGNEPTGATDARDNGKTEVGSQVSTKVGESVAANSTDADRGAIVTPPAADGQDSGLLLVVASDQTVDEGALLSITDIGHFFDEVGEGSGTGASLDAALVGTYMFTIDWGDGTPLDTGTATIDVPGSEGVPVQGSFDGAHRYADNGVYTVTVTLTNDGGQTADGTFAVHVDNVTPTLTVPGNQTIDEGSLLSLPEIGRFTDPGFDNSLNVGGETTERFTFAVDWGDGTELESGPGIIDVEGGPGVPTSGFFSGSHTYADNGVYTVTVTVSDDDGGTVSETFTVTVNNVVPKLIVPPNQTIDEGSLLSLPEIGRFTDPGFDNSLNVGGETTERFTFAVDWGDGTELESGPGIIDIEGGPGVLTSGFFSGSHTYADNGIYTVTVTVSDDDGGTVSETFTVTVNNVAPTLIVPPNQTIDEGSLLSLSEIGRFMDPGFDNSLNVGGETTERFTFAVDWGDGTELESGPGIIDIEGGPGVLTSGFFSGSHTYADNGIYTVTVTVSDDDGGTVSETFTVTVNNVVPTLIVPPNQTIDEGSLLSIPEIGRFMDPGFDNPLNVGGEVTERFTYAIDWGDGTELESNLAPITVEGMPGVMTSGSFSGSHTYADNGVYTVTVTVSDDDGGTISRTFLVTVNNVAPSVMVPPNQTIDEGSLLSIPEIGRFTDPGFDNLLNVGGETTERFTYSINWGDGTPAPELPAPIGVFGGPGVLTSGSFSGSHTYADNGVYTVTVTVSDDDGGVTSATFLVTVNNVAPSVMVPQNQTIDEGSLLSLPDIGKFTDPGFDNLLNVGGETTERFTYSINWGDGTPAPELPAPIGVFGGPGVLTSGSFSGSHTYADNGVYTVTVTVSDDDGGVTSETFIVTVNNVAPSLIVAGDQTVGRNAPLTITDIGKFTDPGFDNPLNVGGETTERFTFAIDWGDGTDVDSGPGPIQTPGAAGILTAGSFNGQHVYANGGIYTVTVTISDDDGGSATGTLLVYVGPTLTVASNRTVDEGSPLAITNIGQFIDPTPASVRPTQGNPDAPYRFTISWGDGTPIQMDSPSMDVPGGPNVAFAGSFDGAHVYADNGLYTVIVTVTSPDGRVDTRTITVTVNNVAPTLAVVGEQTVGQTRPLTLPNIGRFADPGFDNLLNVGGQTTERFTFTINWGDGTPVDVGPGTITTEGGIGVLTAGSFNGQHVFASSGIFVVTVTVSDDDGGSAAASFTVTVASLVPQNLIFLPPGGGGGVPFVRAEVALAEARPLTPPQTTRTDIVRYRAASVAGAETRLVLRIVMPSGIEDKDHDEPLPTETLDQLRKLFRRLPDGHYRIYQIQPDGVERLVIDVIVRQGRSIDAADELGDAGDLAPPAQAHVPPPPDGAPQARQEYETGDQEDIEAAQAEHWVGPALTLGGGFAVLSAPSRRAARIARGARPVAARPLSKVNRLLRRLR